MLLHSLTNFVTEKLYENEPRYNGIYSRNNLPKIKDGVYVIIRNEYRRIGNH